jgi:DNA-binding CsgD family transcriptional regulator
MGRREGAGPSREAIVLGLVDRIYEAALDPSRWTACLESLATATRSTSASLAMHDVGTSVRRALWWMNVDPEIIAEDERWAPRNPFMAAGVHLLRTGFVCRSHEIIAARDVKRSDYFHEYLRRLDALDHIGACIARERDVTSLLFLTRRLAQEPHQREDADLVRLLLPHFQRALAIHRRLADVGTVSSAVVEVLDRLPFGVVLLDARRRMILASAHARELLQARDGLCVAHDGTVHALHGGRLAHLIADACATGARRGLGAGGAVHVRRASGRRPLAVLVAPLRVADDRFGSRHPAAALFVSDPERDGADPREILMHLYGCTPAESAVAWLLLDGKRVAEIADELAVTENTVRTHVKRVLAKVDCRTQADLVRVLLSGPAAFGDPTGRS